MPLFQRFSTNAYFSALLQGSAAYFRYSIYLVAMTGQMYFLYISWIHDNNKVNGVLNATDLPSPDVFSFSFSCTLDARFSMSAATREENERGLHFHECAHVHMTM